jgi:predicted DNA-binding transcriptional regulator AlpA
VTSSEAGLGTERGTATIPELAQRFGIARSSAYELAKRNQLPVPVIRLGRRLVVSRELMERVLSGDPVRIPGVSQ